MSRTVEHALMNRGNSYERQLGRLLSRGRVRQLNYALQRSIDIANKLIKEGGAAGPMVGGDVYTPVAGGPTPPKRKKASRLSIPHE